MMSKDLQKLHDFVQTMAAKGLIQMGELIELMDCVYRLEDKEGWIEQEEEIEK